MGGIIPFPGIEKIVEGYSAIGTDEKTQECRNQGLDKLNALFNAFETARIHHDAENGIVYMESYEVIPYVSEKELQMFIAASVNYENTGDCCARLGLFITKIIENEHYRGVNKFSLDFRMLSIKPDFLGSMLAPANPVYIEIKGCAGDWCIEKARNIRLKADKVGRLCGYAGTNLHIETEEAGDECFKHGEKLEISVQQIGKNCGLARYSTYKTRNRAAFGCLKSKAGGRLGSIVILNDENGVEIEKCLI